MKSQSLLSILAWCSIMLLSLAQQSLAQGKVISGKVSDDQSGDLLPGVTVMVKGTNTGTITAPDGTFKLNINNNASTLVFSFVGYDNKEIAIGNETVFNVTLKNGKALEEVVVVGYGTQRKKDVTGAVTKISTKEFNTGVIANPLQQVQGKVAGLVIVQPGADPNSSMTVRLRGSTSLQGQPPLLVIDGVAMDDFNRGINSVAPGDIESYDILRDASSAAIYGARGANGVIIITTKRGRSGKASLEYSAFAAVERVSNRLKMLSADEWRKAVSDLGLSNAADKGANTDWQKEITRDAVSHSHNLSVSGGSDKLNYRASFNYLKQDGVVRNTGKELLTGRINVNQKALNDRLTINYQLNTSLTKRDLLPDQRDFAKEDGSTIFNLTYNYLPVYPVRNSDGSYFQLIDFELENPVARLNQIYHKKRENFTQGSAKIDYQVAQGLTLGTLLANSRTNELEDYFEPRIPEKNNKSYASKINFDKVFTTFDVHANLKRTFGKHNIDITGVYEYNKYVNQGFQAGARGFLLPDLLNNNLGLNTDIQPNDIASFKDENLLISFLGRVVYNYADKYLVTFNFRRDGSSRFGSNHRWGNFPSAAVAWRISGEEFMKKVTVVNDLKFRINYGTTGNQEDIGQYPYQLLYGNVGAYYNNGNVSNGYGITQLNNPDLKWEVRQSFNIGLDFSLFNSRLNGTVDVFNDRTKDLLFQYDLPQPPFLTNRVIANAANATNKGIEVTLNGDIIRSKNFTWNASLNVASLRNKITNLSGKFQGADLSITARNYGFADGRGLSNAYVTRLIVGQPAGVFWLHHFEGLDANGKQLFTDYQDGKRVGTTTSPTDDDRIYIDPTPKFTYGFTSNFSFKQFDLSFFLRGVSGAKIFTNTLLNLESVTRLPGNNVTKDALSNGFKEQPQPSDYWLRNASYLRMENLTLGYNFKANAIKGINSFRIYVASNNLFVITKYPGIDPEVKVDGNKRYIDRNYYPKTRSFSFGVNVNF
ncbi:TonB-dependent receptor [Chitinophaga pendula]|uniref:SusC/RagA family TonB-linked outer membrane protein n=1 Tax=Chitinophaga TaxID=79328 RepID=UPI000BAED2F5|nr:MULTISPECIES: TonB-dependent receptor [Chitinophaga]ASZ10677.1 hypothetical protein CK934_06625 [Chitinophaga sp. MD30]UCJ06348.1 TonB-dependent receptor [Chitinophaga pendula]